MEQQQTNALATKQSLNSLLSSPAIKNRFDEVLGKKAPSFVSSIISAVNTNKSLQDCVPMTVVSSAMIAASLDMPINANLGFAYIVPYKNKGVSEAQFQIGWKGLVQLALRTAFYKTINATEVYEGQIKKINRFTGEIEFNDEATSEKIIGYLLYFKLLNGYEKYVYWTVKECRDHGKKYSKSFAKGYGLWVDDFDSMALKTVVKMGLSKYGLLSVEMQKAFEVDQAVVDEEGQVIEFPDAPKDVTPAETDVKPDTSEPEKKIEAKSSKSLKNHAPQSREEADKKAAESKQKQQEQQQTQEQETSEEKGPAKTRAELVKDLLSFQSALGITNADFTAEIKTLTNKTTKELTNEEIADLCAVFEGRLYNEMGEDANV